MPPLSTRVLVRLGENIVEQVCPGVLSAPMPFPVLDVFERVLPQFGIHTYPVCDAELPDEEAVTDHEGPEGSEITIRIREEFLDYLAAGGRRAHRARATLPHELGHAILHVPVMRRRLKHPVKARGLLQRHRVGDIPAYEQSEWQAWMLGGSILMPISTLLRLDPLTDFAVADAFQVSLGLARAHLGRLERGGLI
ncbi:MAG: ImmA/IrrE family metallo-endopeptidase [Pseudomonadota bacterium]